MALRLKQKVMRRLARDERGATSIEYALLAGILGLSVIAIVAPLGPPLVAFLLEVATTLTSV